MVQHANCFGFHCIGEDPLDTRFLFFPPECVVCVVATWKPGSIPQWWAIIGRYARRNIASGKKILCKEALLEKVKEAVVKESRLTKMLNKMAHFSIDVAGLRDVLGRIACQQLGSVLQVHNLRCLNGLVTDERAVSVPRIAWDTTVFKNCMGIECCYFNE